MGFDDPVRPGERVLDPMPAAAAGLVFVGRLRTPFATRDACPRQGDPDAGPDCTAEIDPAFVPALLGLAGQGWADVLYWLHGARRDVLVQTGKGTPRGAFALRSPVRPNPIGLARVRLLGVDGGTVLLRGLDCVDGTPLLDIKPARCPHGGGDSAGA